MKYLSLCMNFKNESPYLKEWIDYHLNIGIEHFYLFDNDSTDEYLKILEPYRNKKLVTLHSSKKNPIKPFVYEYVLNTYRNDTRWLGFLDCDEFLCPTNKDDVREIFIEYEKFPGVGINWKMFGNNGHIKKPNGLVIENYTKREGTGENSAGYHIKSFINPQKVLPQWINPHYFIYDQSKCFPYVAAAVNENFEIVDGNPLSKQKFHGPARTNKISYNKFSINHYWCKSLQEYSERKLSKPRDDAGSERNQNIEEFNKFNSVANEIEDTTILRFVDKIKYV